MEMEKESKVLADMLMESVEKVGRERDEAVIDGISGMTREQFKAMIESTRPTEKKSIRLSFVRRNATWLRLAAACIAMVLVIYGINDWRIARPDTNVHASMFNKYYKVDASLMQQYKNEGVRENVWGGKNTATILEEASNEIVSNSKMRVKRGVKQLERLRDNPRCRQSLKHEVHWYLALGYLKQDRHAKAKAELENVVRLGSYHSSDAQKILRQL